MLCIVIVYAENKLNNARLRADQDEHTQEETSEPAPYIGSYMQ